MKTLIFFYSALRTSNISCIENLFSTMNFLVKNYITYYTPPKKKVKQFYLRGLIGLSCIVHKKSFLKICKCTLVYDHILFPSYLTVCLTIKKILPRKFMVSLIFNTSTMTRPHIFYGLSKYIISCF